MNLKVSSEDSNNILLILREALVQARSLLDQQCPWWNVLSVPFHSVCLLLSINTSDSIGMLPEAMEVLKAVAKETDTSRYTSPSDTGTCLSKYL
jgi:hypothetical protein